MYNLLRCVYQENCFRRVNLIHVNPGIKKKLNTLLKELSLCHKLKFSNLYVFAVKCLFQTINPVRVNKPSLKYQRFTPSGCKVKGI